MIEKNSFILILIKYLLIELTLILISSINILLLIISLIIYIYLIIKERNEYEKFSINYYSSIILNIFHYIIFTLSYAEILPWETIIVIIFILLIIYYNKKLSLLTNKSFKYW